MYGEKYARPNPIPRGPGGRFAKDRCFIATAVYGNYEAPQVLALRKFRDERLLTNALGRAFVSTYYLISPAIARQLRSAPVTSSLVRKVLDALVRRIEDCRQ